MTVIDMYEVIYIIGRRCAVCIIPYFIAVHTVGRAERVLASPLVIGMITTDCDD